MTLSRCMQSGFSKCKTFWSKKSPQSSKALKKIGGSRIWKNSVHTMRKSFWRKRNVNFFFLGHETENKTCFTIRTLMVSFNNFQISLTNPLIHFCDFPLKNIIANLFFVSENYFWSRLHSKKYTQWLWFRIRLMLLASIHFLRGM